MKCIGKKNVTEKPKTPKHRTVYFNNGEFI